MLLKKALIIILSLFIFTFFRSFLILLSPFLLVILAYLFNIRITIPMLISVVLLFIGFLVNWIFFEINLINNIVSLLLLYLPVIILVSKPKNSYFTFAQWMKISSIVLIIVDISGLANFFYVLITKTWLLDDSFSGLYGRSGLSMHTLSLINFLYCVYYLDIKDYKRFLIFAFSGFMCFYGLGLLLFLAALSLGLLRTMKMQYLKYVLLAPVLGYAIVLLTTQINPHIFSYMNKNIDRAVNSLVINIPYNEEMEDVRNFETVKTPRKILAFKGAIKRLKQPEIFFFGTSPGTYNSRTSFLLNGEYTRNPLFKKIRIRPKYAEIDIYPLWNKNIIFQFNDGTRNQPFSSIIAIFIEFGVLNGLLLCYLLYRLYKRTLSANPRNALFIRFLFVFAFFNILFENYFEYPEFMILIIIMVKTLELNPKNIKGLSNAEI